MSASVIYKWPVDIAAGTLPNGGNGLYATILGVGTMYWWAGGVPADAMSFVTSYLAGGVVVYGYCMYLNNPQ